MRFCQSCGAQTDADPCPFCGAAASGAAPVPADGLAPTQASRQTEYARPTVPGRGAPTPSKGGRGAQIVFGSIAATAVIGMVLYLLLGRGEDPVLANPGPAVGSIQSEVPGPEVLPDETPSDVPTESSTTTEAPAPTTTTPSPTQVRRRAIAAMEAMVEEDRSQDPIRDQWVAQLASKYEGVVDKTQQAQPFTAAQILAEIQKARSNPEFGSLVRVVHQGDWGGSTPGPKTMWVTFVDLDASDRDQVLGWCEDHFSQRGKSLLNVCYPRQMHSR